MIARLFWFSSLLLMVASLFTPVSESSDGLLLLSHSSLIWSGATGEIPIPYRQGFYFVCGEGVADSAFDIFRILISGKEVGYELSDKGFILLESSCNGVLFGIFSLQVLALGIEFIVILGTAVFFIRVSKSGVSEICKGLAH
jgi:hypothetical protein